LPIGNGRLGAMVFGGISKEHLQLMKKQSGQENPEIMFRKTHSTAFRKSENC
jgi:hypothetical protein